VKKINFVYSKNNNGLESIGAWYTHSLLLLAGVLCIIFFLQTQQLYYIWIARKVCIKKRVVVEKGTSTFSKQQELIRQQKELEDRLHTIETWKSTHNNPAFVLSAILQRCGKEVTLTSYKWNKGLCDIGLEVNSIDAIELINQQLGQLPCFKKIKLVSLTRNTAHYALKISGITAATKIVK
jgi:hypothetical protein